MSETMYLELRGEGVLLVEREIGIGAARMFKFRVTDADGKLVEASLTAQQVVRLASALTHMLSYT